MRFLARNVFTTYGVLATSVLSGLVLTPIIVHALGAQEYGLWAFIGSLAVFFGLLDLGVGPAIVRFAAENRGRGATEETSALASVGLALYGVIALVTMAAGVGLAWLIPVATDIPDDLVWPARVTAILVVAGFAGRFPLGMFGNLLLGHQRYDVVNLGNFVSLVLYAVLVATLLAQGGGIVLLGVLTLVATVVRLAIPLAWLRRELPSLRLRPSLVTRTRLQELLSFSAHNFLIHLASKVVFSTDVIVVGVLLGAEAAAFYAIPAKLFALAFGFSVGGTQMLFSAFAELEGAEQIERQRRYLIAGIRVGMAVVLLVAFPLALLPDRFLEAWLGQGFEASVSVLVLLAVALAFSQPTHTLTQYLIARGRQRPLALARIVTVAVNLGLSLALVKLVGLWGVALATLVTEAASGAIVVPLLAREASGIPAGELVRAWSRPLAIALGAALPSLLAARLLPAETLLELAPVGLLWALLYGALVWRFGLADDERRTLRRSFSFGRPVAARGSVTEAEAGSEGPAY